jgi:ABC-2 type transport system permease protein
MTMISGRRLWALCRKESFQIVRDPSSILVAFILPVLLLFIFGYAINLDAGHLRIGLLLDDTGPAAERLEQALRASSAFDVQRGSSREALLNALKQGEIRGVMIVQSDFSAKVLQGRGDAAIQLLTDGSEPNTASFIAAYLQGVWETWRQGMALDSGTEATPAVAIHLRSWFNPGMVSRHYLDPGSISVVMTIIGALLTSLVVAREWERGTMEALLATPVTRAELLLSKILPYYFLLVAVYILGVPFRGSLVALVVISTLFLGSALGLGLFLSTVLRNQFNAAQAALTAGFLPAMMLSGFVFEIASMPMALQWFTRIIPARYFATSLQTLFQAGTITSLLFINGLFLGLLALFWLGLTAKKTGRTLD